MTPAMHHFGPTRLCAALALVCALLVSACRNDPYCLANCDGDAASNDADLTPDVRTDAPVDRVNDTPVVDTMPDTGNGEAGCVPGAPEVCNNQDDNCDGRTDEGIDTQTDPGNCGGCGQACALPHALPACTAGVCVIPPGGCDTNFFDLDHNPANGCEYSCLMVPGATNDTTCDLRDDDCDGVTDEDVDLCGDPMHCGSCNRGCQLPHAVTGCAPDTAGTTACMETNTHCTVASCEPGFYDIDHSPTNGCEYACTPSGIEVCDGLDNDCNGATDENNPGGGVPCGSAVGECRQGVTLCMGGAVICMGETTPSPELCDNKDNDCNGSTDDGSLSADARVGTVCGSGVGDCRPGRTVCQGGSPTCTGMTGPTAEACDGRDNDCDGNIDNGVATAGPCGNGTGQCAPGTLTCAGGSFRCQGGTGPTLETCNRLDDDCDGVTDNGFDLTRDANNCGSCGRACSALANALVACQSGNCAILACAPGFYNLDGNNANGCEYACSFNSSVEVCNGLDDDCDGQTDESVAAPAGFCRTAGPCAGTTPTCTGRGGFVCNYPATVQVDPSTGQPVSTETRCDSIDNNCNGATDESFTNLGLACDNGGIGECNRTGRFACNGAGTAAVCNAAAVPAPGSETCNGKDDDCDGVTDETRASPGSNASFVNTAWANVGSGLFVMQYEASRPGATGTSAGTASNRACSAGNVLPWTNLTVAQASAACTAAGARLCTEAEWQRACQSSTATCTWSYDATCSTYSSATCNTYDHDVDSTMAGTQNGLLATGALTHCRSLFGANSVYDMSGNVKEFTAPRSANTNALRGGAYNNTAFGTECTFNWSVVDDTFAFVDAGFRCCYSASATPP